tara:strand:- start:34 stop:771 length:738 start_codon:yes stop_codon:yes gene_type:complete
MPTRHEELLEEHRWYTGEHKNADEINLIISTKLTHVSQFPFYAQALAEAVHEGQVDKAGQPYIDHVRRVVAYTQEMLDEQYPLEGKRPGEITTFGTDYNDRQKLHAELISVAWMHDVLEDTPGLTYYHLLHMVERDGQHEVSHDDQADLKRVVHMVSTINRSRDENGEHYETYARYIRRVGNFGPEITGPTAIYNPKTAHTRPLSMVKLADLHDNRGRGGIPKSLEERYDRAIDTLREMQKEEVA